MVTETQHAYKKMDDTEKDKVLCDSFVCLSTLGDLRKQYDQLAREVIFLLRF